MWTVRPACPDEAAEACEVIRRSIGELCHADHDGDLAILAPWLANKTPGQVLSWITTNPVGTLVAVGPGGIVGVSAVLSTGHIALNYVAPEAHGRGVGTALLHAMERVAHAAGHGACTLTSTVTAYTFYLSRSYLDAGSPVPSFGGKPAYPMRRTLP